MKDAPAPRPHKRRRLDASPSHDPSSAKTTISSPADALGTTAKGELRREEFAKVMQRKKGPVWANEPTVEPPAPSQSQPSNVIPPEEAAAQRELSDMEWMKQRMSNAVDTEGPVFEQSDDDELTRGTKTITVR